MVEDFLHLLASHHFLREAIDFAKLRLLPLIIFPASLAVGPDKNAHENQKYHDDQGQPHAQDHHHDNGAHQGQKALDRHGEAVVHGLLHRVHIIGEAAHQFPVGMGVKIL